MTRDAAITALIGLLDEVWTAHSNPEDPNYNNCDEGKCQWCVETREAADTLSALGGRPETGWQPIAELADTLKDGRQFCGGYHHRKHGWLWGEARWDEDGFFYLVGQGGSPTHVLALPSPPLQEQP